MSDERSWPSRPAFVTLVVLLLAIPFHLRPENFVVDDGYFYPVIARHIVAGQGSTFNGIMPTNGYHPLWMLCCVLVSFFTTRAAPLVQALGALQDLFLTSSVILILAIARAARLRGAFVGCLTFLFFNMVLGIWRLLEAPLALLLQIAVLVLAVPLLPFVQARLRGWRVPLLGIALGLTMLARLDLMFFVLVVWASMLVPFRDDNSGRVERAKQAALVAGLIVVIVAPYLLWNWKTFHHLLPISGAIKSTFPHIHAWAIQSFTRPVLLSIVLNLLRGLFGRKTAWNRMCVLVAIGAMLHLAYTLSFGEIAPWYLTTGYLSVSICVIWLLDAMLARLPKLLWIEGALAAGISLLFMCVGTLRAYSNLTFTHLAHGAVSFKTPYLEPRRAFGEQLARRFPAGTRMFIFDAPGGIAFYSGMSLLPVDGLVADYAYNRDLVELGPLRYAALHHIEYFIAPRVPAGTVYNRLSMLGTHTQTGQVYRIQAPLTRQDAGSLDLPNASTVLRFHEVNPELEAEFPEIDVWPITGGAVQAESGAQSPLSNTRQF